MILREDLEIPSHWMGQSTPTNKHIDRPLVNLIEVTRSNNLTCSGYVLVQTREPL